MSLIDFVRGRIHFRDAGAVVIDVGGIGLRLLIPQSDSARLGELGGEIELFAVLHVREDSLTLFGFDNENGRLLFQTLLGVTGVGPRHALSLLSSYSADSLATAISSGDVAVLSSVSGVGKRLAERIVLELRDRLHEIGTFSNTPRLADENQVLGALRALGYSASEARKGVAALEPGEELPLEERVRRALQELGKRTEQ